MIVIYQNGEFDEIGEELAEKLIKEGKARIANQSDAETYLAWLDSGW